MMMMNGLPDQGYGSPCHSSTSSSPPHSSENEDGSLDYEQTFPPDLKFDSYLFESTPHHFMGPQDHQLLDMSEQKYFTQFLDDVAQTKNPFEGYNHQHQPFHQPVFYPQQQQQQQQQPANISSQRQVFRMVQQQQQQEAFVPTSSPSSASSTSPIPASPQHVPVVSFQFQSHSDCDQHSLLQSLQQQQIPKVKTEPTNISILPKARTVPTVSHPQSKIVKGAISTEALKAGMRSAVKTYERRKPKIESVATEARAVQLEQVRKIEKRESSDDESGSGTKELLTEEEKRMNHIASEKKRRNNIRVAFETMTELVPALNGTSFSKATILNKANEYIFYLKERNTALTLEVQRLNELLSMRPEQTPPKAQLQVPLRSTQPAIKNPVPLVAPMAPISKLPKDYTPNYSFQNSDEMKIMMICSCYALACVNLPVILGASQVVEASQSGRTIMSFVDGISQWGAVDLLWAVMRVLLTLFAFYSALTFDNTVSPQSKDFQLAVESRVSGEKASNDVREAYFIKALNLLGCSLSKAPGLWLNLIFQSLRQILHLVGFARVERYLVRQRGVEDQVLELARSYYLLSHVYNSANRVPLIAWVSLLRALNVAESVGTDNNPLLAEIYSQMSYHLRFQLPKNVFLTYLARYYRRLSQEARSRSVCSAKTHGYVALHDALEKIASGNLSEAASDLLIVSNFFLRSNRVRSATEVLIFRGIAYYIHGNVGECAKVSSEIEELAAHVQSDERSDADSALTINSLTWWKKIVLLFSLLHRTTITEARSLLEELEKIEIPHDELKWTENQLLQKTLFKGLAAYICCREGNIEEALKNAEESLLCLNNMPRQTIFLGIAYTTSSLITSTTIECLRSLTGQGKEIENKAVKIHEKTISILQNFGKIINFSAPRAHICQAVSLCLKGQTQLGLKQLSKAEILAVKYNMPMERALALRYKCTFSKGFSVQDALLAESIFSSVGAENEVERMRSLSHASSSSS